MIHFSSLRKYFTPSLVSSEKDSISIQGRTIQLSYQSHPRARRYRLRIRKAGFVHVTLPRRGSREEAYQFVMEQRDWIAHHLNHFPDILHQPWTLETLIFFRGEYQEIQKIEAIQAPLSHLSKKASKSSGIPLRTLVEHALLHVAQKELPPRVNVLALDHQLRVKRITIRNQSSRWGSCSVKGNISLNWRLIQMPLEVCNYILIHELMHLKEMNHSPKFWKLVEQACPEYRKAQAWIRKHAVELGI